ncbi:oxidoreductase [Mycolicibacterium wolinskyi]|uniref:Phthalate 4,5-dioxygenase n=2 Tax=Mycobacteriaceae TaxID=1762 RepID=A0A1X2FHI8_9MYCO|nr:oxidoreductase [Mycolicibacterium wolinskyi]MCV7294193.1 oxidoreductase [Mycolicibacterium goodii]ORX17449.1 phthalate 4,5-dioxygenase [Mycolicibacterium wolinskyi]
MQDLAATPVPDQHVRVEAITKLTPDAVEVLLRSESGSVLAPWDAGAHIDLTLPNWLVRQYSLCGDPADLQRYRIAVRREKLSRGGSEYIHDFLRVGAKLTVSLPRNTFEAPQSGTPMMFIAGGIGITPMLPMFLGARAAGERATLLYTGWSRSSMAFLDELDPHSEDVIVASDDQEGRPDFSQLAANLNGGTQVYACGPEPMLVAIENAFAATSGMPVQIERFRPRARVFAANTEFEVMCARSDRTVTVGNHETMLDALTKAGIATVSGCREGVCGSCEIAVLSGEPEHRDDVGAPDGRMYPCVSRARTELIVVDV